MQVKAPRPDACDCMLADAVEGVCGRGSCRHTKDDYEGHAVGQWQHAAEAIEFWLNGWITVHGVGMR